MKQKQKQKRRALKLWRADSDTHSVVHAGGCVSGPDRVYFWTTFALVSVPCVLVVARALPFLVSALGSATGGALSAVFCVLVAAQMLSLFRAGFSDPGIVPRDPLWRVERVSRVFDHPAAFKDVQVQGKSFEMRFCDTCWMYRSPRTVHCGLCDNCVADFDHHCPWLGNCIGRRNYRDFFVFVVSTMINLLYAIALAVVLFVFRTRLSEEDAGWLKFVDALKHYPDIAAVALYAAIASFPVGSLFSFHIYLASKKLSTNEYIKNVHFAQRPSGVGPFRWCLSNYSHMLWASVPPSFVGGLSTGQHHQRTPLPGLLGITVVPDRHCGPVATTPAPMDGDASASSASASSSRAVSTYSYALAPTQVT